MEMTNIQFLKAMDKLCHAIPYCNECPIMKLGEEKKLLALRYFVCIPKRYSILSVNGLMTMQPICPIFSTNFLMQCFSLTPNIRVLYQWFVEDIFMVQELMDVCLMKVLATSVGKSSTFKPRLEN